MMRRSFRMLQAAEQKKGKMVKDYRIGTVLDECTTSDAVFARKLPQGGCQFIAWPSTPLPMVATALLGMPSHANTFHALFGRRDVPMDIAIDLDGPLDKNFTSAQAKAAQKALLHRALRELDAEIKASGEETESRVVLQSPTLSKSSFHIHVKLKNVAFEDYASLGGFVNTVSKKIPEIDMAIYRPNGMLRLFKAKKENLTCPMTIYADPEAQLGQDVTDVAAMMHSLCIRDKSTFDRTLQYTPVKHDHVEFSGNPQKGGADRITVPLTKSEALQDIRRFIRALHPDFAVEWREWIAVGLNLYDVANEFRGVQLPDWDNRPPMDVLYDEFVEFSKKSPQKFNLSVCEKTWQGFARERNRKPDWVNCYKFLAKKAIESNKSTPSNF